MATEILFQTDQSGANINVCSGQSIIFNFSLTNNYEAVAADIVLKKGSTTTESIVATIYDQQSGLGNVVTSSTVLAANITQSFSTIQFVFANILLSPGILYSLVLSSSELCSGSSPYSAKTGNFQVLNANTNSLLNTGFGISSDISNTTTILSSISSTQALTTSIRLGDIEPKIYLGNILIYENGYSHIFLGSNIEPFIP